MCEEGGDCEPDGDAGSILYVVIELIMICGRAVRKEVMLAGILLGLVLGFGTNFVLVAVGA